MKKLLLALLVTPATLFINAQTTENPFVKRGYNVLVATSSKGEYAEFHDQADIVEIGSVLFNARTNEVVALLSEGETTIDISSATTAMTIDPFCEKYYWISPYAYVANNPLKYIDPDGRSIWIYYKDDNGKEQHFVFNGSNHADAPENQFVTNALIAYDYNVSNKTGKNLVAAATDESIQMNLRENRSSVESTGSKFNKNTGEHTQIVWDPSEAISVPGGHTISPATVLEHEADHAMSAITNPKEHLKKSEKGSDKTYGTLEERRVMSGSDSQTGIANGEYPAGYVRPDHTGNSVKVNTPISNGVLRAKPILFLFKNAGKYKY